MVVEMGREICGNRAVAESREWLCTNGVGDFASGTVAGLLTRRYHGLPVAALQPPLGRTMLVAKLDETADYDGIGYPLAANSWADGTILAGDYRVAGNVVVARRMPTGGGAESDVSLVAVLDRSFARETRTLRIFGVISPDEGSGFSRAILSLNLRDNIWVDSSAGVFGARTTTCSAAWTPAIFGRFA